MQTLMSQIVRFGRIVCQSIVYLLNRAKRRLKELLLAALLLKIFTSLDTLQQFIFSFASDLKNGNVNGGSISIIFFSGLFVNWLCFVCWQKPVNVCKQASIITAFRAYYITPDPSSLLFTAWVATLPMLIVNSSLGLSLLGYCDLTLRSRPDWYQEHIYNKSFTITLIILVVYALVTWFLFIKNKIPSLKSSFYIFLASCGFTFILLGVSSFFFKSLWACLPLIVFIYFPSFSLCAIFYRLSQKLGEEGQLPTARNIQEASIASYILSIIILILTLIPRVTTLPLFSQVFSPVIMLLFVFIFYFQVADFFIHNLKYGAILLLLIWYIAIFYGNKKHFELKETAEDYYRKDPRVVLEKYFDAWYSARKKPHAVQDTIPLYLVAAEGGGSRAAAWTTAVLLKLDSACSRSFSHHLFAISSVSGGSVGAATTIALWDQSKEKDNKLYQGNNINSYVKEVFERNYISSSLGAMFFSDFFQQIPILRCAFAAHPNSRSDRHQAEENDQLNRCLQKIFQIEPTSWHRKTNYLNLYYSKNSNRIRTELPLYFANSTRVQDGRRTVISPVDSLLPKSAVDLLDLGISQKQDTLVLQRLSIGQATNLSQLFPFISSSVYHKHLGSFIDGGTFENMGLTTLSEVYAILKNRIKAKNLKVKMYVIPIYAYDNHDQDRKQLHTIKEPSQIFDPISVLSQTPFAGHTDHMFHWMETQTKNKDGIEFVPIFMKKINSGGYSRAQEKLKIPVSRWLSADELFFMLHRADFEVRQKVQKL